MFGITGHSTIPIAIWALVIAASAVCAIMDLRWRRIPNKFTGPLVLAALVWWTLWAGLPGLGQSLLGMIVTALPFVIIWVLGASGAGDAKMMGAIGAWLGVYYGIAAMLAVALAGGVFAIAWAISHRRMRKTLGNVAAISVGMFLRATGTAKPSPQEELFPRPTSRQLPYGIAIFAGVCGAATWVMLCNT